MRSDRWSLLGGALLASLLFAGPALAGPNGDPRVAARALAEHGHALYEQGKYLEAIEIFQQAEKLYHAPTLVLALAKAHAAAGKLVEARALYRRLIDEVIHVGAPKAFREAQDAGRAELAALERRIPTVQIVVRGGARGARVTLDGADVPTVAPDAGLPVNPGAHRIEVVPASGVGVSRTVDVREGAHERVEIELPSAAPVRPPPPPPPPARPWLGPAVASFGLGAIGLGLGLGAGVVTLKNASALRDRCGGDVCAGTAQNRDDLASAKGLATASTVGFVLAGAGVAAGAVLIALRPGSKAKPSVGLLIGPASAGVAGAFR